jgi:hypothetical protein
MGIERNEVLDLVGWEGLSVGGRVTGLSARFTPRRRFGQNRRRSVRRIRTGRPRGVGGVPVEPVLQRTHPRFQSLDDIFQRLVLSPQTRILAFEFFYPSLKSSAVCFHPLVLKVEHAVAENDSSEMR